MAIFRAPNEDFDQTALMYRLISVFVERTSQKVYVLTLWHIFWSNIHETSNKITFL